MPGIEIIYLINNDLAEIKNETNSEKTDLSRMVFPKGFEPPSSEPESDILSIELRKRIAYCCKNIKLFRILIIGFFEKKKAFLQTLNRSDM